MGTGDLTLEDEEPPPPPEFEFPSDITGLQAWYDAADTTTITHASGAVSQWDDKSGNARHVKQTTAGTKPTTGTRTQNSLNVIDFDGGDYLIADNFDLDFTTSKEITTFIICKPDANTIPEGIYALKRNNIPTHGTWRFNHGVNQWAFNFGLGIDIGVINQYRVQRFTNTDTASFHLFTATLKASTSAFTARYDTANQATVNDEGTMAIASWLSSGSGNMKPLLGALSSAGNNVIDTFGDIAIAELVIYNVLLTSTQITDVESYLKAKWATP